MNKKRNNFISFDTLFKPTNLLLITLFLLASLLSPSQSSAAKTSNETSTIDIKEYADAMQPGWNLGNTFDAVGANETAWGNPYVTRDLIDQIAAQGYKSIRVPITFDQRMDGAPNYTIDSDFLARIDQVVQWSLDADLYVMINIHHDSWIWLEAGMQGNYNESLARYNAIWTQLADRYKDHSLKLMFESINEPRFWGEEQQRFGYLHDLNTSFHSIVRASGGQNDVRPLVLSTMDAGSEQYKMDELYDTIIELNDPNIISTVHYYGFWPFSVNIAGYTRFDQDTKNDIIATFDRVYQTFVANGIPVIIGEYGLLGFDTDTDVIQQGEKLKFFEFMTHYAKEKQLTHMLWDNGQHFSRSTYQWQDPELFNMMRASWEGRSATAESDFIYLKKDEQITDRTIQLQLNGNQLQELVMNGKRLNAGKDYALSGESLTFKANLLNKITSSDQLGTKAVITAKFDNGANWNFDIKTYDTPTLQDTTGTTDSFIIPTSFNGSNLATMEAKYVDGSNAGPQNWTSFKEFGYTFSPSYSNGEIQLKENFFNDITDRDVILSFHFWSGEVVEYKITKNGSFVTGFAQSSEPSLDDTGNDDKKDKKWKKDKKK